MHFKKLFLVLGMSVTLTACAEPQSVPAPITIDPILTKYDSNGEGGGGCPGGQAANSNGNCIPPYDQGDQQPGGGTQIPQANHDPGAGGQGNPAGGGQI